MPYWSTSELKADEQISYWREVVCEAFTPLAPRRDRTHLDSSLNPEGMPGWVSTDELVTINAARIASCTQLITHGSSEVRRAPLDALFVNLQLDGSCVGEQDGRQCRVLPGELAIFDTVRPYSLEFAEPEDIPGSWRVLSFRVPREQWYSTVELHDATAVSIDTNDGVGKVIAAMMSNLWSDRSRQDAATTRTLEQAFIDVLGAAVASCIGRAGMSEDDRRDAALLRMLRTHIRATIPSGRVTAEAAAKAAAISTRTLHRLFEATGTTFSACVRQERMMGAVRELRNAPLTVTLSAIAAHWGFYDSSHMTRAFQDTFGCTPSSYRTDTATPAQDDSPG
ncbi:AraC family transcriptional regulator [Mycolicibacterium mucogenicum]|uniref:AraC family transcriptional regulator n=1 Tax=Mycolicibacterium mucogenicum TaxID=56689 RepID=A0A1A3H2M9_MYCMU|nr:helix-turn-helix domain-containing protein [Mycolicibacterium mucogenicum]OBJ42547.1 AraC family transcriptional regulator [Mycolicibacterium mucogenicum]